MATSNKVLVIESKDGVVGVEELWVEDDLDSVRLAVKELDAPDLVQDGIRGVIGHVVSDDRGQRVSLESKDSSLKQNLVLGGEELVVRKDLGSVLAEAIVKEIQQRPKKFSYT